MILSDEQRMAICHNCEYYDKKGGYCIEGLLHCDKHYEAQAEMSREEQFVEDVRWLWGELKGKPWSILHEHTDNCDCYACGHLRWLLATATAVALERGL